MDLHFADIDECQDPENECPEYQECVNTQGSFSCHCMAGYQRNSSLEQCFGKLSYNYNHDWFTQYPAYMACIIMFQ